jgi:hypothetical protein
MRPDGPHMMRDGFIFFFRWSVVDVSILTQFMSDLIFGTPDGRRHRSKRSVTC